MTHGMLLLTFVDKTTLNITREPSYHWQAALFLRKRRYRSSCLKFTKPICLQSSKFVFLST